MAVSGDRPLFQIAQAFSGLAADVHKDDLQLAPFANASSRISVLFASLGIAFKFAERDYVFKVRDLTEASKVITTLQSLVDIDVRSDAVKNVGSHSRNLLRVKRGLDMVRVLFQGILDCKGDSLRDPAARAYAQVFAPYHSLPIRAAVAAGLYVLPTRTQLLKHLNEDEDSAKELMQEYIGAVDPVIAYVDNLFLSRNLGVDW